MTNVVSAVGPHVAMRPLWICRVDAHPWPCPDVRLSLIREFRDQRTALCIYLGQSLTDAMRDLYTLNPDSAPEPVTLGTRFLGWLPPRARTAPPAPDEREE
jgi:hypothetical protein